MRTVWGCSKAVVLTIVGPVPTPAVSSAENSYPRPFPFVPPTRDTAGLSVTEPTVTCLLTVPTASAFSCSSLSEGSWSPTSKTRNWRTSAAINHLGAKSICLVVLPLSTHVLIHKTRPLFTWCFHVISLLHTRPPPAPRRESPPPSPNKRHSPSRSAHTPPVSHANTPALAILSS